MPIYEYTCKSCGAEFEALVRKDTVVTCQSCKATDIERKFSLPAIKADGTHARALSAAKRRDAKQGAEREHGQKEYEKNHD